MNEKTQGAGKGLLGNKWLLFGVVQTVIALALFCAMSFLMGGCKKNNGKLVCATDGSTSMEKVIGILGEAFEEKYNDCSFTYNPTGSGSGIRAVAEKRCDIGLSSRALKQAELQGGLSETVLAQDGIAVIVNNKNPVSGLTLSDLKNIYTGAVTTWAAFGGADEPIVVIGREAGSGTRDGFESITDTSNKCVYRQELTSGGDVISSVLTNELAIGYTSMATLSEKVKALKIDGVAPSEESVLDKTYKLQRPFVFVTRSEEALGEAGKKFLDFAFSNEAEPLIKKAGVIPVKKK